jgi:hypothetical protein
MACDGQCPLLRLRFKKEDIQKLLRIPLGDCDLNIKPESPDLDQFRDKTCPICAEGYPNIALMPCGHAGLCSQCVLSYENCPCCGSDIVAVHKITPLWTDEKA